MVFEAVDKPNPAPVQLNIPINQTKTALDVLLDAKNQQRYNLKYKVDRKYGGYVKSVCDVESNSASHDYWMFYVNEKQLTVGVSSYYVKPNDTLRMQYMHVNPDSFCKISVDQNFS